MTWLKTLGCAIALVGLLAPSALAQDAEGEGEETIVDPNNPGVVYKKKTEYDFEDDVVEGAFVRPEGEYLDARRRARHSSLIKIRENFVPEMLKSAEDI